MKVWQVMMITILIVVIKSYLFPVAKLVKVDPNILAVLVNCLCSMTVYFTYITLIWEEDKNKQKTKQKGKKEGSPQSGQIEVVNNN